MSISVVGRELTLFPSAARTATPTPVDFPVYQGQGLIVVIDVTAIVSTPSVVFTISGVDPISGKIWTLLASAAIVATGTVILRVSPHLTAAANLIAKDIVPYTCRVAPAHGNANSITYTVVAIPTM